MIEPPSIDPLAVAERYARIVERIETIAVAPSVRVVAVTKGFGTDAVRAALGCGLHEVGENYAQELLAKAGELHAADIRWHFLGRLQRNKVRGLAPVVAVWESVDRPALVDEIARRCPGAAVYVQANLSDEPQKGGAELAAVPGLVERARGAGLDVVGLMGVGPAGEPDAARPGFRALVALADDLEIPVRSIGMSNDLDVALEEGATEVRLGTALFGPRPPRT